MTLRHLRWVALRTADRSFAFAPAASGITWVTAAGGDTLADDVVVGGFARCLGDVIAARIDRVAGGVRDDGTEGDITSALDGDVPSTQEPWDQLLPGATVLLDGDLVRVTVPPRDDAPVGRVLRAMMTGDGAGSVLNRRAPPGVAGGALDVYSTQRP